MSIVDARGREVRRATIEHNAAGLRELLELLSRAGAREVAIERPDGPVVDTLLEAGITVVVISPNQLKNLRGRYGSAGNKDDRFDAFVLADTLRTDRSRLRPLLPDTPATATLRRTCRPRKDLVAHRVALANQLRAHLRVVFPGVVGLFADLDSPISLAFLTFCPVSTARTARTGCRSSAWPAGWPPLATAAVLHDRLTGAPRGATGDEGAANAHITRAMVAALTSVATQIKTLDAQIAEQLSLHADAHIFTSLPPLRHRPRRPAARRDRGLPSPFPHARIVGLPGWRRPLHPSVRQSQTRRIPLGRRQTTPRRRLRLRR